MDEYGIYAQDSWRWKPNVTFTLGLRYELQMPMVADDRQLLEPSTLADLCGTSGLGQRAGRPAVQHLQPGRPQQPDARCRRTRAYDPSNTGYNIDYNNFAPNVGVAWRPNVRTGWLSHDPRRSGAGDDERRLHAQLQP